MGMMVGDEPGRRAEKIAGGHSARRRQSESSREREKTGGLPVKRLKGSFVEQDESGDAHELSSVQRDERVAETKRSGRDRKVVRSNDRALRCQLGPDTRMASGFYQAERHHRE